MRDEAKAFAAWVRADLVQRFDAPKDVPAELAQLIEKACPRG